MTSDHPLRILFFPFMAQGHILPMIDMAKLFASRGVKATIVTTPANAPHFQPSIDRANGLGPQNPIHLSLIPFPSGTELPQGCENLSSVPRHLTGNFFNALEMLRQPFYELLRDVLPDCVVTASFFPWSYDVASELGIPRLMFRGSNCFSRCAHDTLTRHRLLDNSPNDADSVLLPGLPHRIQMLKSQVPDFVKAAPFVVDLLERANASESKSYGVVVNSFYELEPGYADHYRNVMGIRAWHIGPMFLCDDAITTRGSMSAITDDACLKWLDDKRPGSVVYVCFGSASDFTTSQLRELALGLELSGHPFVLVVRDRGEEFVPEGFEEIVKERGLVIRGWAPQLLMLNHVAVGAFLTHCGWNSSLEGITAGLPLITWPLFAEQFYNERLIVDVLKTGIAVGAKEFAWKAEERALVEAAAIGKAVNELMSKGEEAAERRRRAMELGEIAKNAMKEGGSSYADLSNLIEELKEMRNIKGNERGIEKIAGYKCLLDRHSLNLC